MKTKIMMLICMVSMTCFLSPDYLSAGTQLKAGDGLQLLTQPGLEPLTQAWIASYAHARPENNTMAIPLRAEQADIPLGIASEAYLKSHQQLSQWNLVVGRNIIVPVFNSASPFMETIYQKGVSLEELSEMLVNPTAIQWGALLGGGNTQAISILLGPGELVEASLISGLNLPVLGPNVTRYATHQEFVDALKTNVYAIGFCSLSQVLDGPGFLPGLTLLPVDKNNNDRLDAMENFYRDAESFNRACWIGKYPVALCQDIYAFSSRQEIDKNEMEFLSWVLTDGQSVLTANGFAGLTNGERQSNIDRLVTPEISITALQPDYAWVKAFAVIVAGLLLLGFVVTWLFRERKARLVSGGGGPRGISQFNAENIEAPAGLFYDKTHTWTFMENDGFVKIGMDDFLHQLTGKISRVSLKKAGERIAKGDPMVTVIQDGKQIVLHAPVSGVIIRTNDKIAHDLTAKTVAEQWMYHIEPSNWKREVQFLLMVDQYKDWLKDEFTRLKDFLAKSLSTHARQYAHVVLQDGGELRGELLSELGPEVWEDFQNQFLNR
ncbi:MAG: hypothetical protein KKD74_04545 [Bacteroidetes bacterium]|nr:hypothetical protein [Bacteroidota bacterium]